jgi:hypothetical protein
VKLTPEQWAALTAVGQVGMWLALPDGVEIDAYRSGTKPSAMIVISFAGVLTGDRAGDRVNIKMALRGADQSKDRAGFASLVDNDDALNEFIDTARAARFGEIKWNQGMHPAALDQWPAAKVVNPLGKLKPGTRARWEQAGGKVFGGQLIALKSDPVWSRFSIYGRPHPPYDQHGQEAEDVDFDQARHLRLV